MLNPTDISLFFSKDDPQDIRLGELVKSVALPGTNVDTDTHQGGQFAILGYPDDEGIQLNGGRAGAKLAPDTIRKIFYKMTPPHNWKKNFPFIFDIGNVPDSTSLDARHDIALKAVNEISNTDIKIISLGGGHDYGYVDGHAFLEKNIKRSHAVKPVIINFDAHLDVRPNNKSGVITNHSGTPFYRLKEKFKDSFHLIEIGLQPHCNSRTHWEWALENNIDLMTLDSVESTDWDSVWQNKTISGITKNTPVFISFDIDGLAISDAGGCSQAWPTGLKISECLAFLKRLYEQSNTQGLGIYEVSPPLDTDSKTSKAAALLMYNFIFN
jgi:formiminoglutamase